MKNLMKCKLCGSLHAKENMYVINPDTDQEFYVCNICVNNREIFECIDCGNLYTMEYHWGYYQDGLICDNCRGNYFVCNRCDSVFPQEELNYDDVCNEDLCESCMNERYFNLDDVIEDYYFKPDPIFYGKSSDNAYLGVELEVDNTDGNYDKKLIYEAAKTISKDFEDLVYLKHDGSLSHGFEIVNHPCTLEYHQNNLGWQEIMEICKNSTLRSHDTTTAGLHIHLSRSFFGESQETQDLHISKLLILISRFYDSHLLKFSRRRLCELKWCENFGMEYDTSDDEITIVDKMKQLKSKGRYLALNLQNYYTVEFRLFKGTLNFTSFMASLQLVMELSKYAIRTDLKNIPSTSWRDIFVSTKYRELKSYLEERGLI